MDVKAALISLVKDFAYKMQKKNIAAFAGSCAYFFIISIVPLLILISSTLPYTAVTEADLVKALTDITPDFADSIILKLIDEAYEQSVAVFSISALATIWSGALGMLSIIRGLNCIYDVEERRNYFHLRFIAALYTLAMIAIMLVMLLIMVFERVVRNIAVSHFPSIMFVISLSSYLKFLVVIAVSTFFFALIYTFVPSAKMTFVYQLPGAVFSAIVWYVFSWIFSIYVHMLPNNSLSVLLHFQLLTNIPLYCFHIYSVLPYYHLSFQKSNLHLFQIVSDCINHSQSYFVLWFCLLFTFI